MSDDAMQYAELRNPSDPVLVVDDDVASTVAIPGLAVLGLSDWRAGLLRLDGESLAIADQTVLGLCLSETATATVNADAALVAVLEAAGIERRLVEAGAGGAALALAAAELAVAARHRAVATAADMRAALAELRVQHMQMQTDHAELESWVWEALAPKVKLARSWPPSAAVVELGPGTVLHQPLPIPARGFLAAEVHLARSEAATVRLKAALARPAGPAFDGAETEVEVRADTAGWVRLTLPKAPGGLPEDAVLLISQVDGPPVALSLAPPTPFADLHLGGTDAGAPLALRLYQTLPRMPAPPLHDPRFALPADGVTRLIQPTDLGPIEQLPYWTRNVPRRLRAYPDFTRAEYWAKEDAHFVHPSTHRPVVARVPGLTAEGLVQARATVQISRHDTMEIAFALGVVPAGSVTTVEDALPHLGQWVHLLPAEWGEVWVEPPAPLSGPLDLLLATAMPNMPFNRNADALFHAYRVTAKG